MEAVRRRRLGRGDSHIAVERLLDGRRTTELAALALFDDESQGGRVMGEINRRWSPGAGNAFKDCREGAHKGFSGSLLDLVNESRALAQQLRTL